MNQFHSKGVWSPENNLASSGNTWAKDFFSFCQEAIDKEVAFEVFKQHSAFTSIIGSDVRDATFTQKALNRITNTKVQELLPQFSSGDHIGRPFLYEIENIGSIAPGTIYHAAILSDILDRVGEIEGLDVVEIGPGYGGQAKVLLDYGIKSCTLIDMLPASKLQEKYLRLLNYKNVEFWDADNLKKGEWDLAISNWCLSEFNDEGIEFYVKNIISNCSLGYFLMNMWDTGRKNFVIDLMKKYFTSVEIFNEPIETHANNNWLMVVKK